ncbi:MAG: CPBP family intramembrane glutamic endopeptidase, partial [Polyangiales bacterium]
QPRRISLGFALLALLVAFVLAQLFGKLAGDVARQVTHASAGALTAGVVVPSMLASELALVLVSVLVPLLAARPVRESLGLEGAAPAVMLATGVGTVMLGPLGDKLMSVFSTYFPDLTLGVVPALHELAQRLPLIWLWPTFALLPGLAEELLFRGVLQRAVPGPRAAVLVSGCAFALFHVDPVHVVGVLPLGLFLAWAAARSSTTVTIAAHVLNNSVALLALQHAELDVGFGAERALPTEWLLVSLVVFAAAAYTLAQLTRPSAAV